MVIFTCLFYVAVHIRVIGMKYRRGRSPMEIARYTMYKHGREEENKGNKERYIC